MSDTPLGPKVLLLTVVSHDHILRCHCLTDSSESAGHQAADTYTGPLMTVMDFSCICEDWLLLLLVAAALAQCM